MVNTPEKEQLIRMFKSIGETLNAQAHTLHTMKDLIENLNGRLVHLEEDHGIAEGKTVEGPDLRVVGPEATVEGGGEEVALETPEA